MNRELTKEIEELSRLLNDDDISSLYQERYDEKENLKKQIDFLTNKTNSLENYRYNNPSDNSDILKLLNIEIDNLSLKQQALKDDMEVISNKLDENYATLRIYQNYLEKLNKRKDNIDIVCQNYPNLKDSFQAEYQKISNQIALFDKIMQPIKETKTKLEQEYDDKYAIYETIGREIEQKRNKSLQIQNNRTLNIDLKSLVSDKTKLKSLKQDLTNIDNVIDVQKQYNTIINNFKNGLIDNDTLKTQLLDLKKVIISDTELSKRNPQLVNSIVNKLESVVNTNSVQNKGTVNLDEMIEKAQYEINNNKKPKPTNINNYDEYDIFAPEYNSINQRLNKESMQRVPDNLMANLYRDESNTNEEIEEQQEVINVRPAKQSTREKLKSKVVKITAFCLSAIFATTIAANALFKNKHHSQEIGNNVSASDTATPDFELPDINLIPDSLMKNSENYASELPDYIKIKDNSYIYDNSYDAIDKENAMRPYFGYDEEKEIYGVTLQMPDGTIKTLYKDNANFDKDYNNLINRGASVKLYLTGSNNEYEGYYNADDMSVGKKR